MMRRIPIIPTVLVIAAAALMVWLGFWQLGRSDEKAEMIERFSSIPSDAPALPLIAESPESEWEEKYLFRRVTFMCSQPRGMRSTAGRSVGGASGWLHVAECIVPQTDIVDVALGWSRDPNPPEWEGGPVTGVMGSDDKVFADPALAGLAQAARPDPNDLPNNHLAYAGQWFLFALTALVIYGFALRGRAQRKD